MLVYMRLDSISMACAVCNHCIVIIIIDIFKVAETVKTIARTTVLWWEIGLMTRKVKNGKVTFKVG